MLDGADAGPSNSLRQSDQEAANGSLLAAWVPTFAQNAKVGHPSGTAEAVPMLESATRVMAHDAFISYSSKDKTIADAVCARLEARGIRCWIAPRDVQPGQPYGEEIIDAIHDCRVMVLVLSANANASPHIPKEVERAVSGGVSVIPLRVENVLPAKSLDYFISSVHWLDAITPPFESHLESLANTIRTLLPEGSQKVIPGVVPPVIAPAVTPAAPPVAGIPQTSGKTQPKWLWIAIGAAVVLAGGWWVLGNRRAEQTAGGGAAPGNTVVNPNPANPNQGNPVLATPQPAMKLPSNRPVGADPIVGCWHSLQNTPVVVNAGGTLTAGPFTARWRHVGGLVYTFTWPKAVDSVTLSPDGNGLSGGNQYGVSMTAQRVSPGPGITGMWRWYNGVIINISASGTLSAPGLAGSWQNTGPGTYSFTWPSPVDTVTMTGDHQRVSGANQYGFSMGGTRDAVCGG